MGKKYSIIYADPPWQYDRKVGQGIAENHYQTLSIKELKKLPVGKIADKNCSFFVGNFPFLLGKDGCHGKLGFPV